MKIESAKEYFVKKLEKMPKATSLVVVLDPNGFLDLDKDFVDLDGKNWRVYHYDENDLAFRKEYSRRPPDPNFKHIVWITFPEDKITEKINLSHIVDVLAGADEILDLSLDAILQELTPWETWPCEISIYAHEIGGNIDRFVSLYKELRKEIILGAPLKLIHIKILVLACRNPNLSISDLLFKEHNPFDVLKHYLRLIWTNELEEEDLQIIKELAKTGCEINIEDLLPWLEVEGSDIAVFLYLLDILNRFEVANPIIQLKGLGILGFDVDGLGKQFVEKVLSSLKKEPDLLYRIMEISEKNLSIKNMNGIVECLPLKTKEKIAESILNETAPLLVYCLSNCYLKKVVEEKSLSLETLSWAKNIENHPFLQNKIQTTFSADTKDVLLFLQGVAFILETISKPFEARRDFAYLVDWYRESGVFCLELEIAIANKRLKALDPTLKKSLTQFLERLAIAIRKYLERADLYLADLIQSNFPSYISHPRLAINILKELITSRNIHPTEAKKIWILIFDGMRLDTWEKIVKPSISTEFEITQEKLYLGVLPSSTNIARVAILSGTLPSEWQDYKGNYTSDHNILVSRLFGLSQDQGVEKLHIIVNAETDIGQRKLDEKFKIYNILIYNLSDGWIHNFKDDIRALNDYIQGKILRDIISDLEKRIGDNDYIIITSDHGFIELAKEDEIKVPWKYDPFKGEAQRNPITHRRLDNLEHKSGIKIQYRKGEFCTVAKGIKWFGREKGKFERYAHGGISLGEIVVPGVMLRKLVIPIIEFELELPKIVEVAEDEKSPLNIGIKNVGNKEGEYNLSIQLNTGEQTEIVRTIKPKEIESITYTFIPSLKTKSAIIELSYRDVGGKLVKPEKRVLHIKVVPKKGKVEIDLSALDKFDKI